MSICNYILSRHSHMLRKYQAKFRAGKESMCPTFAKLSKTYLEFCISTYTVHFFSQNSSVGKNEQCSLYCLTLLENLTDVAIAQCCIHEQKESSKSIYCIFLLLVASHKYLQYAMFKYTTIRWTHNSELTLHCSTLINLEDRSMSIMSYSTASRWSPSVLSISPVLVTVYHSAHPTRA